MCASSGVVPAASQRLGCGRAALVATRVLADNCRRHSVSRQRVVGRPAASAREPAEEEAPPSDCSHAWLASALVAAQTAALTAAATLLPAGLAHAAEAAPDGFLDLLIKTIDALGPWGPAAFIATVAVAECIPLFPTQPLSLASGLLFGAQTGSLCILTGSTLASVIAFALARGVGRPLAERIISHELAGGGEGGQVQQKLAEVQAVIESGSFWQQAGAVLLLRMTPLVPFSASNYVLGLSPLPLAPYLAGTVGGVGFWAVVYASLGGASRSMLNHKDPDALLADLLSRAGEYTWELTIAGALVACLVAAYFGAGVVRRQLAGADAAAAAAGGSGEHDLGGSGEHEHMSSTRGEWPAPPGGSSNGNGSSGKAGGSSGSSGTAVGSSGKAAASRSSTASVDHE